MTSVLMPYSNYDDAKSLISLYNIALNADDDIDFVEFVGEKLIASGIHFDDETCKHTNKIPHNQTYSIQIHSGVLFHNQEVFVHHTSYFVSLKLNPAFNLTLIMEGVKNSIFRPPVSI